MTRLLGVVALVVAALGLAGTAAGTPGNGTNTVYVFNDCDSGVGQITLVSQASAAGLFATAHVVGSNRPAPLISLDYEVVIDGVGVVESGGYAHENPQQGQPIVSCTGHFDIPGGVVNIEVTGFFPAGA